MTSAKPPRPVLHMRAARKLYPRIWKLTDRLHAEPHQAPDRSLVYLESQQLVIEWANDNLATHKGHHTRAGIQVDAKSGFQAEATRLAAVSAWRRTQGIYRVHPTAFEHLISTPLEGRIPVELLTRLPEWCPYIEYPPACEDAHGVYVFLDWMPALDTTALHIMLDAKECGAPPFAAWHALKHLMVPLFEGRFSIEQCLRIMAEDARALDPSVSISSTSRRTMETYLKEAINLVLYLGSRSADISSQEGDIPYETWRARRKQEHPQPKTPRLWTAAWRIGSALIPAPAHNAGPQAGDPPRNTQRRSPRPHIRRAHWHTFWTGPRRDPSARTPVVKWVPPTTVGGDQIVATIRPVC